MEVTYRINPDDYQAYARHFNQTSPLMRQASRRLRFAPPILVAGVVILLSALLGLGLLFTVVVIASFTLFWVADYPRLHRRMTDANAKKVLGEGRNAGFLCEHRLSIDEGGLSAASELAQSRVS